MGRLSVTERLSLALTLGFQNGVISVKSGWIVVMIVMMIVMMIVIFIFFASNDGWAA